VYVNQEGQTGREKSFHFTEEDKRKNELPHWRDGIGGPWGKSTDERLRRGNR